MKTRKVLAVLLVMGILAVAGTAFAHDKPNHNGRGNCMCEMHKPGPDFGGKVPSPFGMTPNNPHNHDAFMNFCRQFADKFRPNFNQPVGGRHGREHYQQIALFTPDMPDEIRTKTADIAKLRIDLDNVMSKRPLDRAKATEIYTKITQLQDELKIWRFNRKLDRLEKAEKDRKAARDKKPEQAKKDNKKDEKPEKHDKHDDDDD